MTLQAVLESARYLAQAKVIAKNGFEKWVRVETHMDPATARRHMGVARFVRASRALTRDLATLSTAKLYALSALDFASARRVLLGKIKFSRPLQELGDVEFRKEFREHFSLKRKNSNRGHVYQKIYSALRRVQRDMRQNRKFAIKLTPDQRQRISDKFDALTETSKIWRGVA